MSALDVPVATFLLGSALGFVVGVYVVHRFPRT